MKAKSKFIALLFAIFVALPLVAVADTIKLKDGSVIKGKVVGFKDQQFIVLIGDGGRGGGRRSQLQLYFDDVESIEFENVEQTTAAVGNAGNQTASSAPPSSQQRVGDQTPNANRGGGDETSSAANAPQTSAPAAKNNPAVIIGSNTQTPPKTTAPNTGGGVSQVINSQPVPSKSPARGGKFFSLPVKVLADATANGWTNTGIVVRKGQRIRISATGRVSLGGGRFATPAGVGSIADGQRLMPTEPTGALIAVVGDDNNDFIFVGGNREFVAQRDGTLFLGVNEGNLDDNSGAFDTVVEAEATSGNTAQR
jgi:hypothetical protein